MPNTYAAFVFDQIHLLASEVAKPVNQQDPKLIAEYRETIKVSRHSNLISCLIYTTLAPGYYRLTSRSYWGSCN